MAEYVFVENEEPIVKGPSPRVKTKEEKDIETLMANVDYISMMSDIEIPTEDDL